MAKSRTTPEWQADALEAVRTLRQGGIVLHATDTVWGLACDATATSGIDRIYHMKERQPDAPMLLLVENHGMMESLLPHLPDAAWELIETSDRPLTIVGKGAKNGLTPIVPQLFGLDQSLAVRCVKDPYTAFIIRGLGKPIASTSANLSGSNTPNGFEEVHTDIRTAVDYIGRHRRADQVTEQPSMMVRFDDQGRFEMLRN